MTDSPFSKVPVADWITSNEEAFAIFDRFPVSPHHVLVISKRIVPTWFDATTSEQASLMELVNIVKQKLDERLDPKPGGRYTIKRYRSTKRVTEEGWAHETVELQPLNPDPEFKPITITADQSDSMRVIGEFVCVLP